MEVTEKQDSLNVLFLNIEHSDLKADAVWEMAKDADIILIENTSPTDTERNNLNIILNRVNKLSDSPARSGLIENLRSEGDFFSKIAANVIKYRKEMYMVDSPPGGPGHNESETSEQDSNMSLKEFIRGRYDSSFNFFRKSINEKVLSIQIRDRLVTDQLKKLLKDNEEKWRDKKVVVIQGMIHTGTYHMFKREEPNIPSSRKFPDNNFTFILDQEVVNRIKRGESNITNNLLKKLYILRFILGPSLVGQNIFQKDFFDLSYQKVSAFTRKMDPEYVDEIFKRLVSIEDFTHQYTNDEERLNFQYIYATTHIQEIGSELIEKYKAYNRNNS
jgi:hypothetical protein